MHLHCHLLRLKWTMIFRRKRLAHVRSERMFMNASAKKWIFPRKCDVTPRPVWIVCIICTWFLHSLVVTFFVVVVVPCLSSFSFFLCVFCVIWFHLIVVLCECFYLKISVDWNCLSLSIIPCACVCLYKRVNPFFPYPQCTRPYIRIGFGWKWMRIWMMNGIIWMLNCGYVFVSIYPCIPFLY